MQNESLLQNYYLLSKWLALTLSLLSGNSLLIDLFVFISPSQPIKYMLFLILFCLMFYSLRKSTKQYLKVLKLIKTINV